MTRASYGTPKEGDRWLSDEERKAQWMKDSFPEFHDDDALWGYVIQAERQYKVWQHNDIKDVPFLWLMSMGVYDWEDPDKELPQATRAIRYSAALASRMFPRILQVEEKVGLHPDLS